MAHYYINNQRLTESHPLWPRNKDGSISKVLRKDYCKKIGAVLGVTDILATVGNTFWMPKYFGEMGIRAAIEAYKDDHKQLLTLDIDGDCWDLGDIDQGRWFSLASQYYQETRDEPADRGTDLHAMVEDFFTKGVTPSDEAGAEAIRQITAFIWGIHSDGQIESEKMFTYSKDYTDGVLAYGGTVDCIVNGVCLYDWKFCTKPRPPRPTECAQLAAYNQALVANLAHGATNIYLDAATGRIISTKRWTNEDLTKGWQLFVSAYRARMAYEMLEEMA